MKKLLALVLALVMTLGLATVGSNAAFSDEDKIDHEEAVEVMNSLGIIAGKPDGNFDPDGSVTRAEMAKMVSIALLGEIDPKAFEGAASDLTDIKGHWAEGYIKFCVSNGIVSGKGNGIFDPNAQVKTVEAAKMLLVALGYNAEIRKYTGPQWTLNVMRDAQQKGLLDDLTNANTTAAMDRDDAAQMIYNTLDAVRVVEQQSINAKTGEVTLSYVDANAGNMNDKLLGKTFKGQTWMGHFEGNTNTLGLAEKSTIRVRGALEANYVPATSNTLATFPSDFDITYIGEEVKVIFKDGTSGTPNQPDKYDTIYGVYLTGATTVYNTTKGEIQDAKNDLGDGKIKFGDNLYDVASFAATGTSNPVIVSNNFGAATVAAADADDVAALNASVTVTNDTTTTAAEFANYLQATLKVNSPDAIKFICDDNGKIERAYVIDSKIGEVSSVSSSNIQVMGATSKKLEDCEGADGIAKGDVVRFAELYPNAKRVTRFFDDVEKVEGKVTKWDDGDVTVNSVEYKRGANIANVTDYTASSSTQIAKDDVDSELALYTVTAGGKSYYVAWDVITGYNQYAFVVDADSSLGDMKVKAYLPDGTDGVYVLNTDGNEKKADIDTYFITAGANKVNTAGGTIGTVHGVLYPYQLTNSNAKIKLDNERGATTNGGALALATLGVLGGANANNGNKFVSKNLTLVLDTDANTNTATTSQIVASDAAVYLYNAVGDKMYVYKASDLKDFTFADSTYVQYFLKDGKVVAFAGVVGSKPGANTSTSKFGFVTGIANTMFDGDNVIALTVWNGTDSETVYLDTSTTAITKGTYIYYPQSSGTVAAADVQTTTDATYTFTGAVKIKAYDTANNILTTTTDFVGVDGTVNDGATPDQNYRLTSDTQIIGIKKDGNKASTISGVNLYTKTFDRDYPNAYLIIEPKTGYDEVAAIFIDEDNNITGTGDVDKGQVKVNVAGLATNTFNTGATATITTDKTGTGTVIAGETVTFTLTIGGTSDATTTKAYTVTGATLTDGTLTAVSGGAAITSVVISGGNTVTITPTAAAVSGTYTFTGVVTGAVSIA